MRARDNSGLPLCSCGARHYPATTGDGRRVWCDGSSADPLGDMRRAREQERARAARAALLAERSPVDAPPIESWEAHAPDTLPLEF